MSEDMEVKRTINSVVGVEHFGTKIVLPADPRKMEKREAAKILVKAADQEEQFVDFSRKFEGYEPHDVGVHFSRVCKQFFGLVVSQTAVVEGMFGPMRVPPEVISFKTDVNETETIILGQFVLPGINGTVNTQITQERGEKKPRYFQLTAEIMQKDRDLLDDFCNLIEASVKHNSVFKGKQFDYRARDDDGDFLKIPQITFLNLEKVIMPIFDDDVQEKLEVSIYTPIQKTAQWLDAGLPLKRGCLLYGPFGTGKTLTAYTVAKMCRENNWTFIMCSHPEEFGETLRLARNYQPCVVFQEDIDRLTSGGRTVQMDEILNIIDGIESKDSQIMVIVTTNAYDDINKAMLRAGRLDARINIPLPNAVTVGRLLRSYGGNMINPNEDISEACKILANLVTASEVAEVVTLAKGAAIRNDTYIDGKIVLTAKSLTYGATIVREQCDRNTEEKESTLSNQEKAAHVLAAALEKHIDSTKQTQPDFSNGHAAVIS